MIEIDHLTKRYGKVLAVDDVSFGAEAGRVTGFVGPNGAGKTTTLRALLGLVTPTSGSTAIMGRPFGGLDDPARQVGAVLETASFHPGRSGRNHLRTVAAAAGLPRTRVEEVLELVELKDAARRRVKTYSLGMKQRLCLATSLLGDPQVLVLDEPANGLDPEGMRWLRTFLRGLAADGRAVLVSSHVLAELAQTADDIVILAKGRDHRAGADRRAHGPSRRPGARPLAAGRGASRFPRRGRHRSDARRRDTLGVDAPPERIGEIAAANGIVLHELRAEESSLEEVFLELTGGEEARPG